jgi:PAS domain S-box-containing protein
MKKITEINLSKLQKLEMLASIACEADNSILIIEVDGKIRWANKAFEKLYGCKLSELTNKGDNDDFGFITAISEIDSNFFQNNTSLSFSREITTNGNVRKWIQSTLTPVKDNNKIKHFVVIESDITHQKEVEEELVQRWENTQTLNEHIEIVKEYVENQIKELNKQKDALQVAKDKSEDVLKKVLPYEVAIQLKKKGFATPRQYKKVTLLNLNIRNFSHLSDIVPIDELVKQLHELLVKFDNILDSHYVEKIKNYGGIYLGAGGVPLRNRSNPIDVVLAAIEIQKTVEQTNIAREQAGRTPFVVGIGIHTGKVIAGIVGKNKLSYDIWGDTVNITADIEKNIPEGKIFISEDTFNSISEFFNAEEKAAVTFDTNIQLKIFEVIGIKKEFAEDEDGIIPNSKFMKILSKL